MADSGVDTSNESSDNPVFDQSQCVLEFSPPSVPINLPGGQPVQTTFFSDPHEYIGKMKFSTRARHCRLKHRYGGFICDSKNIKLRFAASTNNAGLVEKLLLSGADPNSSDEHKRSPLHLAACRGYVEVVKMLLRHGANPNIKDTLGSTPLHLAACTNHTAVVIELLDAGTDVSSNDKNGRNPIQLAQSKLKLMLMRPKATENLEDTRQLISDLCLVVRMIAKYNRIKKADAGDLESVCERLERISTREQVDSEVQNLLDGLDCLKV